jgi:hypothetical protein
MTLDRAVLDKGIGELPLKSFAPFPLDLNVGVRPTDGST